VYRTSPDGGPAKLVGWAHTTLFEMLCTQDRGGRGGLGQRMLLQLCQLPASAEEARAEAVAPVAPPASVAGPVGAGATVGAGHIDDDDGGRPYIEVREVSLLLRAASACESLNEEWQHFVSLATRMAERKQEQGDEKYLQALEDGGAD
jgi:hypothetical protein